MSKLLESFIGNYFACTYRRAYSRASSRKVLLRHMETGRKIDSRIVRYLHQRHQTWRAVIHYVNLNIIGARFVRHVRDSQVSRLR
jgi:hypothetical protein